MSKAENFIQDCTRNCSNETTKYGSYDHTYQEWLTPDQALRVVEIAREEIYEWLLKNAHIYASGDGLYTHSMINDLKQALKDENTK